MSGDPEPKRRARPDQAEHGLSHWVDAFMDRAFLCPGWYTAVETGGWMRDESREARMNAENKRRARGIKPAHLDWYAWQQSTGLFTQFELKVDNRPTRPGQDQTMVLLRRNNIPTAVCQTVPEVCEFLSGAGFALHGNARNIAIELHEQYLAKRRAHGTTAPKKSRPRKSAPSKSPGLRMSQRAAGRGILF